MIFHKNKDYSSNNQMKISKSIESIENKTEIFNINNFKEKNNNKNTKISNEKFNKSIKYIEENKFKQFSQFKNDININSRNKKSPSLTNKIIRNTINYMSDNLSSTNSQEKLKRNIKFQNRNDRINATFANYNNLSSYSINNINNKSKKSNILNSNKNTNVNNVSNYSNKIYNKKIKNLKNNIISNGQYDTSYNLIFDNNDVKFKNKTPLITDHKEKITNKSLKSFYINNIKNKRKNEKEKIRKNNIYGINNTILKEIKEKIYQNIKKAEIINDKNLKNNNNTTIFNSEIPIKKHKNKIINNQNQINNKDNLSIILLNPKSKIDNENFKSPIYNKIKTKIQYNSDSSKIEKKEKNIKRKTSNEKTNFESSVITYRYKSPLIIRELSDSPKNKYLNEKMRYSQIPWKIKKKGIDDKLSEEIIYKKYFKKINKNPFIINNNKIKKNKLKIIKIQVLSYNKQNSCSLNKNKKKAKIKFNNMNTINTCYSKDNTHNNALNLKYKINSQKIQNSKNKMIEINNQSINFLDIKSFPILKDNNKKYY